MTGRYDTADPTWNMPRTRYLMKAPGWQNWLERQPLTVRCAKCGQTVTGPAGELWHWHRDHHCETTAG